ncbi:MAG: PBP1A family penicillin-binding protein [Leptospirales bacterium]|nr:PBP1A family penicillin-binding protein [Leptospirales bacterium]
MNLNLKKVLLTAEGIVVAGIFSAALIGGLVFGLILSQVQGRQELQLLASYRPSTPTRLYDRNGEVFAELYRHKQELVRLQDIPPHVVQAFLAVEDDNFYNHFGLDIPGIFRAMVKNVLAGDIVQGGSTLTQQLAKAIYQGAEGERKRSFFNKIRETILALEIEENLSKEEILEVYFNVIYLGHGCQGIACASRLYFDKNVQDLTIAEGALLARMPKAPNDYSPFRYPGAAKKAHIAVLQRMVAAGYLRQDQVAGIHNDFWARYWDRVVVESPNRSLWGQRLDRAPYFTEYVRQILEATPEVGPELLYTQGLRVYTTLDMNHQRIAEEEMKKQIDEVNRYSRANAQAGGRGGVDFSLFGIRNSLAMFVPVSAPYSRGLDDRGQLRKEMEAEMLDGAQLLSFLTPANNEASAFEEFRKDTYTYTSNLTVQGAFVSIEPRSGYITSMIGGADFSPKNQFNRVLRARRQPGSAFKIFVYGAALETRAYSSTSAVNDAPFYTIAPDGSAWSPGNYDQGFMGLVPAKRAFALSLNTPAVMTFFRVGPEPIIDLAARLMKISDTSRFNPDPAMALGSSEITPMELATAVSIIANNGKDVFPFPVRYVTDQSGETIYNQEDRLRRLIALRTRENRIQVIEPGLAYILRTMMKEVANAGTAVHGVRGDGGFRGDLACKTGTTSNFSDAWITGFNPEYASAIWFGFDKSSITMGSGMAGGQIAAPVMGSFYRRIYQQSNRAYPEFKQLPDRDQPPPDVLPTPCDGFGLREREIDGVVIQAATDGSCGGERIYDYRELLMQQMGISPEDIGREGHVRFRSD